MIKYLRRDLLSFSKKKSICIMILVYVDDKIITRDDMMEADRLSLQISSKFGIRLSGRLEYFLGIELKSYIYLTTEIYMGPFERYRETCMQTSRHPN